MDMVSSPLRMVLHIKALLRMIEWLIEHFRVLQAYKPKEEGLVKKLLLRQWIRQFQLSKILKLAQVYQDNKPPLLSLLQPM
jgi:hypothetical protein